MRNTTISFLLAAALAGAVSTSRAQSTNAPISITVTDQALLMAQAMGSPMKAETGPANLNNSVWPMVSGVMHFAAVYLPTPQVLSGIVQYQVSPGAYTPSGFNGAALYSFNLSTGMLSLVAVTANIPGFWGNSADVYVPAAFTQSYAAPAGLMFEAFLYCSSAQTARPYSGNVMSHMGAGAMMIPNGGLLTGFLSGQTSFPASIPISSLVTEDAIWGGLY